MLPAAQPGKPKFHPINEFHRVLRQRVDQFFIDSGRKQRHCPGMYLKTALVLCWFVGSYLALLLLGGPWWLNVPLAVSLGLSMAGVGFNIQHDGSHGAYSEYPWLNKLMAMTLDLLGGSSYIWARKHNSIHHSYANIAGHDDDIDIGFFGRLSPHQKRLRFHRFQHWYLWPLYGCLPIKWQIYDDFRDMFNGQIGSQQFSRAQGWDLITFIGGKVIFFTLALGIPLCLYPPLAVFSLWILTSFVQGVVLSIVFQLGHCVEEAAFHQPNPDTGRMDAPWAVHQVETTVDFARSYRLLSWYIGGLNFQIEHHLFPRICHLHYPALAPLVESTCREFGLRYQAHETLFSGIASHFRWLRRMGKPTDELLCSNHASSVPEAL
jgi:linoleoyl-CoA desaturase